MALPHHAWREMKGGGGSAPRVASATCGIGHACGVGHAWAFKWYLVCVVLQLLSRVLGFPCEAVIHNATRGLKIREKSQK